ncbi:MAG: mechanosensitive ion channel [Halobacteriales archaeon]|nr:mechanosensitive ion channel [Halobacteriales archaeon]
MVTQAVTNGMEDIVVSVKNALPRLVLAAIVVALAYVVIKISLAVLRSALDKGYDDEEKLVVDLMVTVTGVFMWFAVALVVLNVLGLGQIAASLGTATGFIALGISYALSDMIADTVAGVYLLRDPDFNKGDTVEAGGVTGVVESIELRKTRLSVEDDTVVLPNGQVEKGWTLEGDA